MMGGALPFELFPGHQAPSCSDNEALSAMARSERPAREKFLNFVGDSSSSASHPGSCGCRRGTPVARMRAGRAPLDPKLCAAPHRPLRMCTRAREKSLKNFRPVWP